MQIIQLVPLAELDEVAQRIEVLKKHLDRIVNPKLNIFDPDMIAISKMLDSALNEYNEVIKQCKRGELSSHFYNLK